MRVALVSPYSWTYPGGVTRHIEALAGELIGRGPRRPRARAVRPRRPPDRPAASRRAPAARRRARVARPARADGRLVRPTARCRTSRYTPLRASRACAGELRAGRYDVVHVHEPVAPVVGLGRADLGATRRSSARSTATPSSACRTRSRRCSARAASSTTCSACGSRSPRRPPGPAGASTAATLPRHPQRRRAPDARRSRAPAPARAPGEPLRIVFVGQAVERKGLPVLLRAFEALRAQVPGRADGRRRRGRASSAPLLLDPAGVRALGRVGRRRASAPRWRPRDVLCAPSLGGESFGMVLTEAFAAGTPVVASDIAGYRDVVSARPRRAARAAAATPPRLAETLRDLALDPAPSPRGWAPRPRRSAERYAWPRVAAEVLEAYEDARRGRRPAGARRARRRARGRAAADGARAEPARRLPSLEPPRRAAARPALRVVRRARSAAPALAGVRRGARARSGSGCDRSATRCSRSSPAWVLVALALMCRLDGPARRLLARDPARRAARRAAAARRRAAGRPRSAC